MFDNGEEKVLQMYPDVVKKYQDEFAFAKNSISDVNTVDAFMNEGGTSNEKSMVRVRANSNTPVVRNDSYDTPSVSDYPYYGPSSDFNQFNPGQKGTSFVLVIVALLALVILVSVVTFSILRTLGM